ncbi:MAG: Gfo/Idh/MocA family oxidoreductase [Planctomycetota bacterium]|nr:Gfo/Idh/MocA family oxidoreductase [Planctomycetota bacterium]
MTTATKTYTAAVIGVGKAGGGGPKGGGHAIGYVHAGTFKANPRVKLAAGADINAENLRAYRERFGVPLGFEDYRALLKDLKPDLVSIGTYVGLHRRIIEDAARAGVKGILCEKPFLNAPADLDAVERVAAETGAKIVVGHMRRYRPAFERARDLYNDGTVGKPLMCLGGIEGWDLSEWGSHWLDIFRFFNKDRAVNWIMGQARVRGFRGYGHAMEEHAVAYFEFEGGAKAILDGGKAVGQGLTLLGAEGVIRVRDEAIVTVENGSGRAIEDFSSHPRHNAIWPKVLEELIDWIEGGPIPRVGHPSMLKTCELNLAAYLSALKGDRIDLPLSGELRAYDEWPVEALARRTS